MCVLACDATGAIVATDDYRVARYHMEMGVHGLVVGDTFGIGATHNTHNIVRKSDRTFFYHLVVAYNIYYCRGRKQRYTVQFILRKFDVSNFDDAFTTELAALQVVAYGDVFVHRLNAEHAHGLEECGRRYMVDDSAVAQSGYGEFFLSQVIICSVYESRYSDVGGIYAESPANDSLASI